MEKKTIQENSKTKFKKVQKLSRKFKGIIKIWLTFSLRDSMIILVNIYDRSMFLVKKLLIKSVITIFIKKTQ